MKKIKKLKGYFSLTEIILWLISVVLIVTAFIVFDNGNYLTLTASVIGVTSLIFNAKGNPFGQLLMIIFSVLYGVISFSFSYYGEMITYLGMTAPMALFSLVSWLRHPYKGKKSQVEVNNLKPAEWPLIIVLTAVVTIVFYFILNYFKTANILPSTLSVTTSFIAVYLTFRRSPWFAVAYAANDIVLIILWVLATFKDVSYLSVIICFVMFLINDLYGFYNWQKMKKKQSE